MACVRIRLHTLLSLNLQSRQQSKHIHIYVQFVRRTPVAAKKEEKKKKNGRHKLNWFHNPKLILWRIICVCVCGRSRARGAMIRGIFVQCVWHSLSLIHYSFAWVIVKSLSAEAETRFDDLTYDECVITNATHTHTQPQTIHHNQSFSFHISNKNLRYQKVFFAMRADVCMSRDYIAVAAAAWLFIKIWNFRIFYGIR